MDYDRKLASLRDRRRGISDLQKSQQALDAAEPIRRSVAESYETRSTKKATKYALGSMQEVDSSYTNKSIEEGNRVISQINARRDPSVTLGYRFQGSVPLNVHIKGVSDVDILVIREDIITYDSLGPKGNSYTAWGGESSPVTLMRLRARCKASLDAAFPAVKVDDSGGKSICLSGGSLARKIDVIASHWHDSAAFQAYGVERARGIVIYDKKAQTSLRNFPFVHINEINLKDVIVRGNLKKIIRLLKNVKADSDDAEKIGLSSYEIAGLVWHVNNDLIMADPWFELRLVNAAREYLNYLKNNKAAAMRLMAPDGTRILLDKTKKFDGLVLLSLEIEQLCEEIAAEINPDYRLYPSLVPKALNETRII
jgi:hypothetical protein